ncbi:MAG: M28 family peptidase, partial [Acidimicrobiales bacterium]|nr:M28 family peptidase [Acidimicrobiales bacterium]
MPALLLALASAPSIASAGPSDDGCNNRNFTTIDQFLQCVNGDDVYTHLQAFQDIADANDGTRASGTPGYDASADYVQGLLEAAGYEVTIQEFAFTLFTEVSSSLSNNGAAIETQTMSFSGSGSLTNANVIPVDLALGLGNASTSGCEAADFDGLDFSGSNDLALIQRGACAFGSKALNAQAAGAEAVVIFNQGNTEARKGIIGGTLGEGVVGTLTIPVLDVAYDDGVALVGAENVNLAAETINDTKATSNIIADMDGVNTDNVVMAGAHLDSVAAGPGINDNGSGSATILAVALQMANNKKFTPQNSIRFAWWGAEESGLIGSTEYIFNPEFGISDEDYFALAAYLNFDMVGSANFIYGVYDADESTFTASAPVPAGSAALEDLFEAYYT